MVDEPSTTLPSDADSAEQAVRRYLTSLQDPARLRDEARIAQLRAELDKADDPLDRVRIHAALRRAEQVDVARLEDEFAKHAGAFAEAEGLEAGDFRAVGVPEAVLRRVFGGPPPGPEPRRRAAPRRRVSLERIREGIMAMTGPFVLAEVGQQVGGSPQSIRKVVDGLVAEGLLERLGPDPQHSGRGRAPVRYRRTG